MLPLSLSVGHRPWEGRARFANHPSGQSLLALSAAGHGATDAGRRGRAAAGRPNILPSGSGSGSGGSVDGLQLRVGDQALGPQLATEPGVLDAAERSGRIWQVAVDPDRSRLHPLSDSLAARNVGGPHRPAETQVVVVGQLEGLL